MPSNCDFSSDRRGDAQCRIPIARRFWPGGARSVAILTSPTHHRGLELASTSPHPSSGSRGENLVLRVAATALTEVVTSDRPGLLRTPLGLCRLRRSNAHDAQRRAFASPFLAMWLRSRLVPTLRLELRDPLLQCPHLRCHVVRSDESGAATGTDGRRWKRRLLAPSVKLRLGCDDAGCGSGSACCETEPRTRSGHAPHGRVRGMRGTAASNLLRHDASATRATGRGPARLLLARRLALA